MKLKLLKRSAERKLDAKRLRREGLIPAVCYSKGKVGENIAVDATEFKSFLRQVLPGRLPTTIFSLVDQGKERRVIIKDIQYNIINYDVISLDFEELHDNQHVNIKVPIESSGANECIGVKLGGVLRQVIRHVRVRCLPKDIPAFFTLDVTELQMSQSKRLSDIKWPETVRPLADLKEVAVVIVKR